MKTGTRVWLLVAVLAFSHLLLHVGFGIGRAAPDLLTVALLLGARELGMGRAAGLGLFFGLVQAAAGIVIVPSLAMMVPAR